MDNDFFIIILTKNEMELLKDLLYKLLDQGNSYGKESKMKINLVNLLHKLEN